MRKPRMRLVRKNQVQVEWSDKPATALVSVALSNNSGFSKRLHKLICRILFALGDGVS